MHRINLKPVSVNECFTGRRFKTDLYKRYIDSIGFMAPKIKMPEPPFQIHLKFGFSNEASDFDNCVKTTIDSLAKKYGFNDKLIRRAIIDIEIVPVKKEYFEFEITTLTKK